jgi:hypothetical protein
MHDSIGEESKRQRALKRMKVTESPRRPSLCDQQEWWKESLCALADTYYSVRRICRFLSSPVQYRLVFSGISVIDQHSCSHSKGWCGSWNASQSSVRPLNHRNHKTFCCNHSCAGTSSPVPLKNRTTIGDSLGRFCYPSLYPVVKLSIFQTVADPRVQVKVSAIKSSGNNHSSPLQRDVFQNISSIILCSTITP